MASLQDLRQRRHSVQSSQKLTSAMKMVANAKFTQFQKQWLRVSEHRRFLEENLSHVASELEPADFPVLAQRSPAAPQRTLVILIGADRGLCGGFNSQLIRMFRTQQMTIEMHNQELWVMACGNRMGVFLEKSGVHLLERAPMGVRPHLHQAQHLIDTACALFLKREIETCVLIYTQFINALRQQVIAYPLLPFVEPFQKRASRSLEWPLLEPTALTLCDALCRMTLESVVYQALMESCLSEQGARMTAMENATRNSQEVLKNLELLYNRKRQSLITNELLEVISGANA